MMSTIREEDIEKYLIYQVQKRLGGRSHKYTSPGRRAVPDRLLLWPLNGHAFVEVKAPGKAPTAKQMLELRRLWELNQNATWVSTKEEVDWVIDALLEDHALNADFDKMLHEIL